MYYVLNKCDLSSLGTLTEGWGLVWGYLDFLDSLNGRWWILGSRLELLHHQSPFWHYCSGLVSSRPPCP